MKKLDSVYKVSIISIVVNIVLFIISFIVTTIFSLKLFSTPFNKIIKFEKENNKLSKEDI